MGAGGGGGGAWLAGLVGLRRVSLSSSTTFVVRVPSFSTMAGSLWCLIGGGRVLVAFLAVLSSFWMLSMRLLTA